MSRGWTGYYTARRRIRGYQRRRYYRNSNYTKKWNYKRLTFTCAYIVGPDSTGTNNGPYGMWQLSTPHTGNIAYTFDFDTFLTHTGVASLLRGEEFSQYKITGCRFISNPNNRNWSKAMTQDVQVWAGIVPTNKSNQQNQVNYQAAMSSNLWFPLSPFSSVSKYIPIHSDFINVNDECDLRFGVTNSVNSALNYSPEFQLVVKFYVLARGNIYSRRIPVGLDKQIGPRPA